MPTVGVVTPIRATRTEHVDWLIEAIQSVKAQTVQDWRMVIVNDRSELKFGQYPALTKELDDPRIVGTKADKPGVSSARNEAARQLGGPGVCLLPLDADDLLPDYAMEVYLAEWAKDPQGILYGHTQILQNDAQRVHSAVEYDYERLLQGLMMPVGSFHSWADWNRIGGWDPGMDGGLEDWEYWVRMGRFGVCGKPIPKIMYVYRRHPWSRMSYLRTTAGAYESAYQRMRLKHEDVYAGRYPMGCCGGSAKRRPKPATPAAAMAVQQLTAQVAEAKSQPAGLVQVRYVGDMKGSFGVNGRVTKHPYRVPGAGRLVMMSDGTVGVDARDVPAMLAMDRGKAFTREP